MKTFTQKLAETRNLNAIERLYRLMADCGMKPERFNEWLLDQSMNPNIDISESAIYWIDNETNFLEAGFWKDVKTGAGYGAGMGLLGGPGGFLGGGLIGAGLGAAKNLWSRFGKNPEDQQDYQQDYEQPQPAVSLDTAIKDLKTKLSSSPEMARIMEDPRLKDAVDKMIGKLQQNLNQIAANAYPKRQKQQKQQQQQTKQQQQPQQQQADVSAALQPFQATAALGVENVESGDSDPLEGFFPHEKPGNWFAF